MAAPATSRARVWAPWIGLAVALVVVLAVVAVRSRPSNSPAARAARLTSEFRCPTCESESIANSNSLAAKALRADVKARIAAGQTDGEIRAAEVARYTQYVLLLPEGHGLGLVVWVVPIAALFVGAAGLALAMRRWTRQPRLAATAADEQIVARARTEE